MRFLYFGALAVALITLAFALVTKAAKVVILGTEPGAFLKATDTSLLFAIFFLLLSWSKEKR